MSNIDEDAENVAQIITRTDTDARGVLFAAVAAALHQRSQFFSESIFAAASKMYRTNKHDWKTTEVGNWYTEYTCQICYEVRVIDDDGKRDVLGTMCKGRGKRKP